MRENLASKLLSLHMEDEEKIEKIVKEYNNKSHHGYTISRTEAKSAGLPITDPEPELEKLMWDLWINIEDELKYRVPFYPPSLLIGKFDARGRPLQSAREDTSIALLESKKLRCACNVQIIVSASPVTPIEFNNSRIDIGVDIVPMGWNRLKMEDII